MGKGKRFKGYYVIYVIHDPSTVRPGSCGRKRPRPKCGCTVDYKKRCKYYGVDELEDHRPGQLGLWTRVCRGRRARVGGLVRVQEGKPLPEQLEQQPDD